MFSIRSNLNAVSGDLHLDRMLRCSVFAQRPCYPGRWLGFVAGRIMPSRASCQTKWKTPIGSHVTEGCVEGPRADVTRSSSDQVSPNRIFE